MEEISRDRGVPSTAAIAGHPLHPMLIPFPIAFLIGALATDLAFAGTNDGFWAMASRWLIAAGLATGIVAALVGLIDFASTSQARRLVAARFHFGGNLVILLLAAANLLWRWNDPVGRALPWGLGMSAATSILLVATGWLGGHLVYRHMIGVAGPTIRLPGELPSVREGMDMGRPPPEPSLKQQPGATARKTNEPPRRTGGRS